jgi:hypothetical protein
MNYINETPLSTCTLGFIQAPILPPTCLHLHKSEKENFPCKTLFYPFQNMTNYSFKRKCQKDICVKLILLMFGKTKQG